MDPSFFPSKFWSFIIVSLFLIFSPNYVLANSYLSCSIPFDCGSIQGIRYPFWGSDRPESCGHPGFKLICNGNVPEIGIMSARYEVLEIDSRLQMLRVARIDYIDGICPTHLINSTFETSCFQYLNQEIRNISVFYGCEDSENSASIPQISDQLDCTINGTDMRSYYVTNQSVIDDGSFVSCNKSVIIQVPGSEVGSLEERRSSDALQEAVRAGIWLRWSANDSLCNTCLNQRGQCGVNLTSGEFTCYYCPDGENCLLWSRAGGSNSKNRIIGLTVGVTIAAIVLVCFIVLWFKRKSLSHLLCHGKMDDNATIEAFIINFGSFGPKRYFYGEIKKMTNKFSHKLGQGGYGSVYKGKLSDGRLVAVKVLSESKGNGEDFMNEVASISRTSHVNIVTLLGFCVERSKRALIYEFMPNGSLDKFIYSQGPDNQRRQLELKTLNDIALGIARGLEYLHQGCNTRILHFDIKPHNILLDKNFCPKISDFGLSKLCKMKESIVSMACARGTIGYIAPEVFCRSFGEVSYKSDVYSYGMLVLEMVGGRKNINVEVSQTSEIYFPTWIYKRLEQSMNLNLNGVTIEEEEEITRKQIIVSLWCIQSDPSNRPSMTKVLEMLQGSLQSLVIPPRPFVSSPLRSHETMAEELGSTS